jgi:lysozyme
MKYSIVFFALIFVVSCSDYNTNDYIIGIDVSHYQDDVDWRGIRDTRISFAIVKATEGTNWHDRYFEYNWKLIEQAGIVRGAYHFFNFYSSPEQQFENFAKHVHLKKGDLPPVLDVEHAKKMPSKEKIRENVRIWLRLAEKKYKVKPIIYTGRSFYDDYLSGYFPGYPLWIASYGKKPPELADGLAWTIWQYTDKGKVKGIDHSVDLNYFDGDKNALKNLCIK